MGYRLRASKLSFNANLYHMNYKDQLVLTGALDDVGGPIRQNVSNSYRSGLELQLGYKPRDTWNIEVNTTLSKNKIKEHNYLVFDTQYDPNTFETVSYSPVITKLNNTDISFSPSFIAGSVISYSPTEELKFSLISKYVGQQYLDNTQSNTKRIEAYFVNNFNATLVLRPKWVKQLRLDLLVNNIFNEMYQSNGYTFSYYYRPQGSNDAAIKENFYYPQAGVNYLLGLTMNL
jgi:iron complex outermembrane receptor protein